MSKCGICERQEELVCGSCMGQELLRMRIGYLEFLESIDGAKGEIDEILANVQQNKIILKFVKKEIELGDVEQKSVVLNSKLLTIDLILMRFKLVKLRKQIDKIKEKRNNRMNKLKEVKEKIASKKDYIERLKMSRNVNKEEIKELNTNNTRLIRQVDISKSLLFQELINLYLVKKQKSGIMISFSPVISIFSLLEMNKEVIDSSLSKTVKFINSVGKILLLELPYRVRVQYQYVDNNVIDLNKEQLEGFIDVVSKLIFNTVYLLRKLQLINNMGFKQLFRFDELVYKLCYNESNLEESDKTPTLDQLKNKINQYVEQKRGNKSEWDVIE